MSWKFRSLSLKVWNEAKHEATFYINSVFFFFQVLLISFLEVLVKKLKIIFLLLKSIIFNVLVISNTGIKCL